MKCPPPNTEPFLLNLGKAKELRCASDVTDSSCGKCEACVLKQELTELKKWFLLTENPTRRTFVLGLVQRLNSPDILRKIYFLCHPITGKDVVYTSTRTNPSLNTDKGSVDLEDEVIVTDSVEKSISDSWLWFEKANFWTKYSYILSVMQDCDAHTVSLVAAEAEMLLASEKFAAKLPGESPSDC